MHLEPGVGELYVGDQGTSMIQVFDLEGNFLRSFGGMVIEHGWFTKWYEWEGYFVRIQSLAFDDLAQLHVLDCYLDKVQILDPDTGTYLSSYGENGTGPGQLDLPTDIAIDNLGRTVVSDGRNQKVEIIHTAP
jgi:DNA-binding beta-propeller fold protein YncE